ncbi:CubicO group peptidase, beta-lactamase class C family [Lentzea fradiae]|uniref:CubicO group peptidase, beta-lactamase class C family n=1 Tax=Lentzea fradiae TaxID=200378 RepID=A0A1G7S5R3_9PSEU|nr:serine hydrolase domain-containing protein [Lentzea fradiae]SDG18338.1 CubicO group peptidase, beta-lactamase class C family [Lentzea fradiae]
MELSSEWLAGLLAEHGVVGAQVAVLHEDEITDFSAGVLNKDTGEEVTTDSIFQIGSITKVWTATLVQELVNEGLLDLDWPVREVLPEFRLADEEAARVITPRHLLTHTAGFDGDLFHDTGNGPDMLERYVERMADTEQRTPPGELYTYCNSGFVVLGRIVEVLRGRRFTAVLRERLVDRLGLPTAAVSHAEYAHQRCASGHLGDDDLRPVEKPMVEGDTPAGSVLAMSARDLLEFVRLHLGTTEFDVMRETQVVPPDFGQGGRQGLGWVLHDYDGGVTGIGHNGTTRGFQAHLRVIPAAGLAVALLTNGGGSLPVAREVFRQVLGEHAGVRLRPLPAPPASPVPIAMDRVVGVYRSAGLDLHVAEGTGGRVTVRFEQRGDTFRGLLDESEREFTGLRDDALIAVEPRGGYHSVVVLCGRDEQDRVKWVHFGRAATRM